jgi:hypothetical protein
VSARLAIVPQPDVPCYAWEHRHLSIYFPKQHPQGGNCADRGRDVAVFKPGRPVCLYCGLDSGLIPPIEQPFDEGTF